MNAPERIDPIYPRNPTTGFGKERPGRVMSTSHLSRFRQVCCILYVKFGWASFSAAKRYDIFSINSTTTCRLIPRVPQHVHIYIASNAKIQILESCIGTNNKTRVEKGRTWRTLLFVKLHGANPRGEEGERPNLCPLAPDKRLHQGAGDRRAE